MKVIGLFIIILLLYSCNDYEWKYKKGDVVEQKLVKGLLLVQDTARINNEPAYKLISGTGSHRLIEEYKLEYVKSYQ